MAMVEQIPVESYLIGRNIDFKTVPHTETYTTISEARALGIPADELLKAVLLRLSDGFALAAVPGSRRLDMKLVKEATTDPHVRLASEDEIVAAFPAFELGALPPIPGILGVKAYVDPAVLDHDAVAFAAGKQTESIIAAPRAVFWGQEVVVSPISREPGEEDEHWRFES
jgi:Ala-tRNA(Pro) deacylase